MEIKVFMLPVKMGFMIINFDHVKSISIDKVQNVTADGVLMAPVWCLEVDIIDSPNGATSKTYETYEDAKAALSTIYNSLVIPRVQ